MNFMFLPLEHKIHIFSLPCNILYEVNETLAKEEKAVGTRGPWFGSSHRGRSSDVPYKRRGMISRALVLGVGRGGETSLFQLCGDEPHIGYGFLTLLS